MDDSIEINLRPARHVGQRLIALVAMLHRAELETRSGQHAAAELEEERFDIAAWLDDQQISDALSPIETRFIAARVGTITETELDGLSAIQGSIEAVAWSLKLITYLRSDIDTIDVIAEVPGPEDRVGAFLQTASLRPLAAIADAREESEVWAWRFDIEIEARNENRSIYPEDQEVIRVVLNEMAEAGATVESIDGDFVMDGFPVARVDTTLVEYAYAIEIERLRALNWISGYGSNWDDVPLEID